MALAAPVGTSACHPADTATAVDGSVVRDAASDAPTDAGEAVDANVCAPIPLEAGQFGEDGSCGNFYALPCGIGADAAIENCYPTVDFCLATCPTDFFVSCSFPAPTCLDFAVDPDAAVFLDCSTCVGNIGRRPAGVRGPRRGRGRTALGRHFSLAAALERASVEAFAELEARLAGFGAPIRLRRRARSAAADERVHARITARLARRFGGDVQRVRRRRPSRLTFDAFVRDNAVEGCVHETYGALLAIYQRDHAQDPEVRAAMQRIAQDETRHAELAWAIHRWAEPQLTPEARRRVRAAQRSAFAGLAAGLGAWAPAVVHEGGMPPAAIEARLLQALFALTQP